MTQLEYDRGDLLRYREFRQQRACAYVLISNPVGGRHGHLGCETQLMQKAFNMRWGDVLNQHFLLIGNKGFTLPESCGWLNVVDADES